MHLRQLEGRALLSRPSVVNDRCECRPNTDDTEVVPPRLHATEQVYNML